MNNSVKPYLPETKNKVIMTGRNYDNKIVNFVLHDLVNLDPCYPQQLMQVRVPDSLIPTVDQAVQIYRVYPEMNNFWTTGYSNHKELYYICKDGLFMRHDFGPSYLYIVKEV